MKRLIVHFMIAGCAAFLPVSGNPSAPFPAHPEFTGSHNRFAFHLLRTVQHQHANSNTLISPLGMYLSLGMLYNGAAHDTRDSITQVLHTIDMGESNLNGLCKDLMQRMSLQDDKAELSIASSFWCNKKKCQSSRNFEKLCEDYYYAPVRSMNFGGRESVRQINRWADQNTRNRISTVIGQTSPKDIAYLINASSFTSNWQFPFDPKETYEDLFYSPAGGKTKTFFMKRKMVAKACSDTSFTMVELPCGNGKGYSMYLVFPDDPEQPMKEFMAGLDETRFQDAVARLNDQWVELSLPRWENSYTLQDMRPELRQMGLGILFSDYGNTDLSSCFAKPRKVEWNVDDLMAGRPARVRTNYLSRVIHKATIRINEKGIQSGSAAGVQPSDMAPSRAHRSLIIKADHPFFYAILSKQQQVLLMAGVVNDPGKNSTQD